MAGYALPQDVASGLQYGPEAQLSLNRSRYLAQALQQMREGSQNIRTPTQLWSNLLAAAITQWSKDKADKSALETVRADRTSNANALLGALRGSGGTPGAPAPASVPVGLLPPPEPPQAAPMAPQPLATTMGAPPSRPPGGKRLTTEEARALAAEILPGAVFTSGRRTPEQQADLIRRGYKPSPTSHHLDGNAWDMVPPKGADIAQFRAQLEARGAPISELLHENKGGPREHWHWSFAPQGGAQAAATPAVQYAGLNAPGPPPPPPPPDPRGPSVQDVRAMAGPPAMSGPAPAASPPQAAAAGATTMQATPAQLALAEQLLSNPRTYDQGVQYAMKLRETLAEPMKWESVTINGLPFERNPYTGQTRQIAMPEGVQTQVLPAQQAGIASAPNGVYVQRDPLGNIKDVPGGPPQGYGVQGDGYSPIRGGPADPFRPQAPATGYEYRGGAQQPIQGGPADPRNPQAVLAGTESVRREIAPIMDLAQKLRRNVEGIRVGYQQRNGAGDIAMINGLQRLIDEGVVREGDVALQLKGQGLEGTVSGLRGYMTSQGFFADPVVRDKVSRVGEALYDQINRGYQSRVMGYKPIVENAYGSGSFDRFVFTPDMATSVGWGGAAPNRAPPPPDASSVAGSVPAGSMDGAIAEAVKRGLPLTPQMQKRARELKLIR